MKKKILLALSLIFSLILLACNQIATLEYKLTISIEGQGSLEPREKTYPKGATVLVNPQAAEGWEFSSWAGKNAQELKEFGSSWQLFMDSDKELTAIFLEKEKALCYDLNIVLEGQGTVTPGGGSFLAGQIVAFTIEPANNWHFSHWAGPHREEVRKVAGQWQITMDSSKELRAVFVEYLEDEVYALEITCQGEGKIERKPDASYYLPQTLVELKALPAFGWYFLDWQGDFISDKEEITILMEANKSLVANFAQEIHELKLTIFGEGKVEKSLEAPSINYPHGTIIKLKAIPAPDWLFLEWQGDLNGTEEETSMLVDGPKEIEAHFVAKEYSLDLQIVGQGTVNEQILAGTKKYPYGTVLEIQAQPEAGWEFKEWQGDLTGTVALREILIDRDKKIIAFFRIASENMFRLSISKSGQGNINLEPDKEEYKPGEEVLLTARPEAGWLFLEWLGEGEGSAPQLRINMDKDKTIGAVFIKDNKYYKLSLSCQGEGQISQEPLFDEYLAGSEIILRAKAAPYWQFLGWSGDLEDTRETIKFKICADTNLLANFKELPTYKLTSKVYGRGSITINPEEDKFLPGTEVYLQAVPVDKYSSFDRWLVNGEDYGSSVVIKLEMLEDFTVVAFFK